MTEKAWDEIACPYCGHDIEWVFFSEKEKTPTHFVFRIGPKGVWYLMTEDEAKRFDTLVKEFDSLLPTDFTRQVKILREIGKFKNCYPADIRFSKPEEV